MPHTAEFDAAKGPFLSKAISTSTNTIDADALSTSCRILQTIGRYALKQSEDPTPAADEGAFKSLAIIYSHVKCRQPIVMCLPAFPFKSPNAVLKVLGKLPDKAEDWALAHLHGLCKAIEDFYAPGATLTIISDGLVYNDLLGVPDKDVWAYGENLRSLATQRGYSRISFSRLRDLVDIPLPEHLDEMVYVANASNFRRALLNTFGRPDWEWKAASRSEDTCLTYRGYIKFLETDLQYVYPQGVNRSKSKYKKGIEYIAKQMLERGDAFANAVRSKYKSHVRLSIHASTGTSKLSISPLQTSSIYTTPWHCTVAFMLDGTVMSGMRTEFENDDRFELVCENGRPSFFREKSDLLSWGHGSGGITCVPIYPCGLLVQPSNGHGSMALADIDATKVRQLSELNSPLVLRGFCKAIDRESFVSKSHEFGKPLSWKFGLVLEVKDLGSNSRGLNNVLSAEWMPFHFDGLFKTTEHTDESGKQVLVPQPPHFQFFAGVTSSPRDTGFTLFSSSTLVFRHLPHWLTSDVLSRLTWSVRTTSFDNTVINGLPLVVSHPTTAKPCLRYHEPWPQGKTKFDATEVTIDGYDEIASAKICSAIDEVLHDRRVTYYHVWEKGDLVVSDNILTLHTRSDFTAGSDRELWRIHFD